MFTVCYSMGMFILNPQIWCCWGRGQDPFLSRCTYFVHTNVIQWTLPPADRCLSPKVGMKSRPFYNNNLPASVCNYYRLGFRSKKLRRK